MDYDDDDDEKQEIVVEQYLKCCAYYYYLVGLRTSMWLDIIATTVSQPFIVVKQSMTSQAWLTADQQTSCFATNSQKIMYLIAMTQALWQNLSIKKRHLRKLLKLIKLRLRIRLSSLTFSSNY